MHRTGLLMSSLLFETPSQRQGSYPGTLCKLYKLAICLPFLHPTMCIPINRKLNLQANYPLTLPV